MEKMFHGEVGLASVLTSFLEGEDDVEHIFDEAAIENNREGNADQRNAKILKLLDIFSCNKGEYKTVEFVQLSMDKGFDRQIASYLLANQEAAL
jgi:hypothetical protein